jgi:hypothetical protein
MKTCATCKYWTLETDQYTHRPLEYGLCDATPMYFNATEWSKDGDDRVILQKYANTTAFVQDASDYRAYLYTRPIHGCTMHEEKS